MNNDDRGVSEILGYILVFSLVVSSVAIVSTVGLGQLEAVRNSEQLNNAEQAFDLLATNVEDIARRGAPSRSTEMQLANGQLTIADPITVTFRGNDTDAPDTNNFSESYHVHPIRYTGQADDRHVVYVAGAVFRTNRGTGSAVKKPAIVASDGDVSIPLIHTRADSVQSRSGGTARVRANHAQSVLFVSDADGTYDEFFMNVTSPRANLWVDALDGYEEFSCTLEKTPVDKAVCNVDEPDRLQVSLVQIDVTLND